MSFLFTQEEKKKWIAIFFQIAPFSIDIHADVEPVLSKEQIHYIWCHVAARLEITLDELYREVPYIESIDGTRDHPFYPILIESIFGTKPEWKTKCYWEIYCRYKFI